MLELLVLILLGDGGRRDGNLGVLHLTLHHSLIVVLVVRYFVRARSSLHLLAFHIILVIVFLLGRHLVPIVAIVDEDAKIWIALVAHHWHSQLLLLLHV